MDDSHGLARVQHVVLVLSGKGGVGKSSVSTQLALSLAARRPQQPGASSTTGAKSAAGPRVGVMDIDLTGPSIPRMLGIDDAGKVLTAAGGDGVWIPAVVPGGARGDAISVMSLGLLLPGRDDPVVWRGPKKAAMIAQFVGQVQWGELEYLVIDTPPGTGDEHIAIMEALRGVPNKSAVIVTTPQAVAIADVRKEISFCAKVKLPILGIVENMSGFRCPHCAVLFSFLQIFKKTALICMFNKKDCTDIFSSGGGQRLAAEFKLPFLGALPIDPAFAQLVDSPPQDEKEQLVDVYRATSMARDFDAISQKVVDGLAALSI
ncbi:P-loop containing nucleoside triphosphate hydrolase protein [Blastocladiella britannica]|nr:P-loop containing nucleoside triphosphate hydrolase protein [Blastocladiella britannica]